jgi:hypothetical protein
LHDTVVRQHSGLGLAEDLDARRGGQGHVAASVAVRVEYRQTSTVRVRELGRVLDGWASVPFAFWAKTDSL